MKKNLVMKAQKTIAFIAALFLAEAIPFGSYQGVVFAKDQTEPGVYYGFRFENENDGYLLFSRGKAETLTTTAILSGAAFRSGIGIEDFDTDKLPEGLVLSGVKSVGQNEIQLGFHFDGIAGDGILFSGEPFIDFDVHPFAPKAIGHLLLDIKPSGIAGGNGGKAVAVPIVTEVKLEGVIPFGARLYREMMTMPASYGLTKDDYPRHQNILEGAVMDYARDIIPSPYVSENDYYNIYGSDSGSLNMLYNYKTIQQAAFYSCGLASALTVVDWFDEREGTVGQSHYVLNEQDLSKLRGPGREWGRATSQSELNNVFEGLNNIYGQDWEYVSGYDLRSTSQAIVRDMSITDLAVTGGALGGTGLEMTLFEAIPWYVKHGVPVILGSQNWYGHYQVAIGYDDMNTVDISDDVLILCDPYDDSDQLQDGYIIQPYERFINDWSVKFDRNFTNFVFTAAWPAGHDFSVEYSPVPKTGGVKLHDDPTNGIQGAANLIQAGALGTAYKARLAGQIKAWNESPDSPYRGLIDIGSDGLSGPGGADRFGKANYNHSPYYKNLDAYNLKDGDGVNIKIIEKYQSIQQATDYTDGPAALLSALRYYGDKYDLTEIDLANLRGKTNNSTSLGTSVKEMAAMVDGLNSRYGAQWEYITTEDNLWTYLGDPSFEAEFDGVSLTNYDNLFSYFAENNIPVLVYWHENGGHWQTVIGYDDMGTVTVHDDVLILADSNDVNDHNQDGFMVQSWYRLAYDWANSTDPDYKNFAYIVVYPKAEQITTGMDIVRSGNDVLANFRVNNTGVTAASYNCILAVYDAQGRMIGSETSTAVVQPGDREAFSLSIAAGAGATAKAFLWDGNFVPVFEPVVEDIRDVGTSEAYIRVDQNQR
ncbi:hypothetical protein FACS1894127_1640 [Clostridia bacterium]|nr:hypothetical protein FACS1894127_1640 [Clostridia bacterium]